MNETKKITVIGGDGRWGSKLVEITKSKGYAVSIIEAQHSPDDHTCKEADAIIIAVRGKHFINACETWLKGKFGDQTLIINTTKTILAINGRLTLPHHIIRQYASNYVTLACGCFPEDIRKGYSVDATVFQCKANNEIIKNLFADTSIKIGFSSDIVGGEIGSALKNIIAIASGMCLGLEYPEMTRSRLINQIGHEIVQIATKHGADPQTFALGYSCFMADLIGTCFSPSSHNLQAGIALARKFQPNSAEGLWALKVLKEVGELGNMPWARLIYQIAIGDADISEFKKKLA